MNTIVYVDKNGKKIEMLVSDFCTVTIKIDHGKVKKAIREESVIMEERTLSEQDEM